MSYGVDFRPPWVKISLDDYIEEAFEDGSQLRAVAEIQDLRSGNLEYWGILEDDPEEDDED